MAGLVRIIKAGGTNCLRSRDADGPGSPQILS